MRRRLCWFLKLQVLLITTLCNFMRMPTPMYSLLWLYEQPISLTELSFNTFFGYTSLIVFSGKHQLNKGDIILQSESRFHFSDHGTDEGLIGLSLKNWTTADVKRYSLETEVSFYLILLVVDLRGFCFLKTYCHLSSKVLRCSQWLVKQQESTDNIQHSWFLQFYF